MNKRQRFILIISVVLVFTMLAAFSFATNLLGKTTGYITAYAIYLFVFCLPCSLIAFSFNTSSILKAYNCTQVKNKFYLLLYISLAFTPAVATAIVSFYPTINKAPFIVYILAFVYAVLNGGLEELFWRGAFISSFKGSLVLSYIYPTVMFAIWHLALILANGMVYKGGAIALVGGAAVMGMIWGYIAYKTNSIKIVTVAHIMVNFFAFSSLIFDNWYSK